MLRDSGKERKIVGRLKVCRKFRVCEPKIAISKRFESIFGTAFVIGIGFEVV